MEYPTLKRPKRKLCYPTNRENSSKQWSGELLLEDVSRIFDDLASRDDVIPPSLLLETEDEQVEKEASGVLKERLLTEKPPGHQMVPKEVVLHPAARSPSPKLDIDIPFKGHGPVKTSSPIERDIGAEQQDNGKDQIVSPILFLCEDKEQEEAKKCNRHTAEENDDFNLESPPVKIVLIKPKSTHKDNVKVSHKESHPGDEKIPTKSQIPVLVGKQKTQRQENTDLPVPEMTQDPEQPAPEKTLESVPREPAAETSNRVGKEMTSFLQKLRDAGQPKLTVSKKSQSPVKVPVCPPEPDDDFLILEDDAPIRFTILSKNATKRRQMLNKTSSTDKDSSTDKGMKDVLVSVETTQKQQEPDQANTKLQTVNQKMKKKGKERQKEVTETGSDKDEWSTPENFSAGDLVEKDKPNQKTQQRLKKESNKAEDKPEDTASRETEEENSAKPQKSSEVKRSKSSKYEKAKTSKAKSLKQTRKEMQGSEGVKETVKVRSSEEDADVEDVASLSDKEIEKSEAQTANEKTKQSKQSAVSVGSSSDDGQAAGKRKRKPPGEWWLFSPESTEQTKVTDNQPILKRSKPSRIELGEEISPPAKDKKNGLLKQRHHNTNKKKTKLNKRRTKRGDNPDKMKTTVEEQTEDQEDQDSPQSSPLIFSHRDHSSGDQIFQRVYHHSHSSAPASPISPGRPSEQLGTTKTDKRRRKPPSQRWKADNMSEDVESVSSQPQQLNPKEPKPRKERKTRSKQSRSAQLGTPKKGNTAVLPKPPGGAPVVHLTPRRAPETVKHMAIFKDIFTSATESSAAINKRETGQNNRYEVTACPAEDSAAEDSAAEDSAAEDSAAEDSAAYCAALSNTNKDILRIDAGESNHESPPIIRRRST
ncbi:glutamic acid-rich protein [Scomber scombrus]|uniref:glutamic acid-rich protein n=1 Tax=Scomber scombrus TaxID=13677 RepID=UPI002DD8D37C|nr:glutamic acid-rich protein [Scomber scombrus]